MISRSPYVAAAKQVLIFPFRSIVGNNDTSIVTRVLVWLERRAYLLAIFYKMLQIRLRQVLENLVEIILKKDNV